MTDSVEKLEPEAHQLLKEAAAALSSGGELDTQLTGAMALISIAVSLKRIADALSLTPAGATQSTVRDILSGIEMNTRGGP